MVRYIANAGTTSSNCWHYTAGTHDDSGSVVGDAASTARQNTGGVLQSALQLVCDDSGSDATYLASLGSVRKPSHLCTAMSRGKQCRSWLTRLSSASSGHLCASSGQRNEFCTSAGPWNGSLSAQSTATPEDAPLHGGARICTIASHARSL